MEATRNDKEQEKSVAVSPITPSTISCQLTKESRIHLPSSEYASDKRLSDDNIPTVTESEQHGRAQDKTIEKGEQKGNNLNQ